MIGDNDHYALGLVVLTFAEGFRKNFTYPIGFFGSLKSSRTSEKALAASAKQVQTIANQLTAELVSSTGCLFKRIERTAR